MLLEKEDEMDCAVSGCNFLLKAVQHEAFSYEDGQAVFTSGGGPLLCPSGVSQSQQPATLTCNISSAIFRRLTYTS